MRAYGQHEIKQETPKTLYTKILSFVCLLLVGLAPLAAQQTTPAVDSLRVQMEPQGGFYDFPQTVTLFAPGAEEIFYTLDGTTPSQRSIRYLGPITLDETTVLRVVAYLDGHPSPLVGATYFFQEPRTDLPVVSIGITPSLLFDPYRGIFMQGGQVVDTLWYKPGANFWTRREFAAHIDIFESDGSNVYNNLSGLRLFGGMSRLFPQKSLAIVARKRYGQSRFDHPIFGEEGPKKFKFLVLRNSGSDFGKSHIRDALMTGLVRDWDMETQAYQPSHVYINGRYWGIYNIREKVNRYFIESNTKGIDRDSIDLLEHLLVRKRGSRAHYRQLLDFLERYDLQLNSNYRHLTTQMEVDNFLQYQIAQIYFDNRDAGGNIKYWRPQTEDGRWRWILYDTDWGFGLHHADAYRFNSLAFHTEPNGPNWPNPPWSTFLLRKLLQNDNFRQQFVNRFADHLNTTFQETRVRQHIDSLYFLLRPEMSRHLQRWRLSEKRWESQIQIMRDFALERPTYVRQHLAERFQTGELRDVIIQSTPGGKVILNEYVEVGSQGLLGKYFANYPITLRAVPAYGHRFVGWEGYVQDSEQREFSVDLKKDRRYQFRAIFEPYAHPLLGQVMINEVCAKNKYTGDWLEIHNRSEKTVNLEGWVLTDIQNEFIFPRVELLPQDYLIVCRDAQRFRETFNDAYNVIGGLGFGLNKREENLALYSRLGAAVDSFSYQVPPLDTAFTLALLLPTLDNADPENWELREGFGTPNAPNPYYVESSIRSVQAQWMQIGLATGLFILSLLLLRLRLKKVI